MLKKNGNVFKYAFCILSLIFTLIAIISCSGLFGDFLKNDSDTTNEITITITGTIHNPFENEGAVPSGYANLVSNDSVGRYALPNLPNDTTTTVTANATEEQTITLQDVGNSFSIGLKPGKVWTVNVTMEADGKEILTGSATFDLTTDAITTQDIYLKPLSSGSGTISLGFSGGGSNGVFNSVEVVSVTKNGEDKKSDWDGAVQVTTSGISMQENKTLAGGIYDVLFHFMKDSQVVYSTAQAINVFPNMTTDKWVTSLTDDDGKLCITQDLVNAFVNHDFYVDSVNGNDNNKGTSPYYPFKTISKAVTYIGDLSAKDNSDNTIQYKIHVKDGSQETLSTSMNIKANYDVTIECWKDSIGDKKGTATITWNSTQNGTILYIDGKLTIEGDKISGSSTSWSGLILDGNKDSEKPASGMGCRNNGILHLKGGMIRNCAYAPSYGTALSITGSGTVVIDGGIICYNRGRYGDTSMGSVYLSTDADVGLTLNDGMISNNLYEDGNNTPGIYISKGKFLMTGGEISNNIYTGTREGYGSGVRLPTSDSSDAIFDMRGGTIYGNVGVKGGAVYGYYGPSRKVKFYISGSAYIPEGDSEGNTGKGKNDVFVSNTNNFKVIISDDLTHSGTIATLTPQDYTSTNPLLTITEGSDVQLSDACSKFTVTTQNVNGTLTQWFINSEGYLKNNETINLGSGNANITYPSIPYILQGSGSNNDKQVDIGHNVQTTENQTYNITLDHVHREVQQDAAAFAVFNNNNTQLTVNVTLLGDNIMQGYNHGGIKLTSAAVGSSYNDSAVINLVFDTLSTGTFSFKSISSKDLQVERVTANISIANGCTFNGTINGTTYDNSDAFFLAAQNTTSGSNQNGCSFTITRQ